MKEFQTERLILKPTDISDAAFILELVNTPKWLKFVGDRKIYSIADAQKYIEDKILPQQQTLGFSNYTIIRKKDQVKMGSCGLYDRERLEEVDIGFAFLPAYEGHGYGLESATKILSLAFDNFGLKKVCAITTRENIASQKLLEKVGFRFIKDIKIPMDDELLMYFEIEKK